MPCKINNEEYIQDISNPLSKLDTNQKNGKLKPKFVFKCTIIHIYFLHNELAMNTEFE